MKSFIACLLCLFFAVAIASSANAHFGMIIPSASTVMEREKSAIELEISFSHPFAGKGMNMLPPKKFGYWRNGEYVDMTAALKPVKIMDGIGYAASCEIARPGVYAFAVEPQPYFESAEDRFIMHYAKTVVGAYGAESDWEMPLGLPVEIVPKLRPFANYAGNVFVGQVLAKGEPVPNALVEVEHYNRNGARGAPNAYFETQTVFCDQNGVFAFGIPWAGWWGFAALVDSEEKLPHRDGEKPVELGGIIWLEFAAPKSLPQSDGATNSGSLWKD